ncbi:divergent polysaccharide deacetylase family protein [Paenibacillus hexagrammi]|uniref:Divergent polysaccharide deacetylase family protein n=1 Tax=Paenibacillus hexagrammi TaxID=2908839 RepID=A0ABY3SDG5_9BACL|nr:divergent polysaccharide deacetylase family protein [Paenibacillus sp. YPD9-1]UJF32032.1 divergent polysaccharide deacetylase family protein [Paenibacillus sp. YPD9-1]
MRKRVLRFQLIASVGMLVLMLLLYPSELGAADEPAASPQPSPNSQALKKIAIVIDDFGNNMDGTEQMMNMPVPLTIAVMPFLPSSKQDAETAHAKGHEVILHLPMEPVRGKKSWLGPGAITTDLSNDEIRKRVLAALDNVPYVVGINNHMGSKATSDPRVMQVIVDIAKEKGLFLLDSRTSPRSVVVKLAKENGVSYAENSLFFDDIYTYGHISKQMTRFQKLIKDNEQLIAIGHVGPPGKKTAQVIKEAIPALQKKAQFVTVSQLLTVPPAKLDVP